MIPAWLAEHGTRILVWGAVILMLILCGELDGYRRGQLKLYEYQAEEARKSAAIVTKVVTQTRTVENAADAKLKNDFDSLHAQYAILRNHAGSQAASLSSAVNQLAACHADAGKQPRVQDIGRVLDDVENAILGILETGDTEIAKYRALYKRDQELSTIH